MTRENRHDVPFRAYSVSSVVRWFHGSAVQRTPRRGDHRPFHTEARKARNAGKMTIGNRQDVLPGVFYVFRGSVVPRCKELLAGVTIAHFTTETRKPGGAGKMSKRESSRRASGRILCLPWFRGKWAMVSGEEFFAPRNHGTRKTRTPEARLDHSGHLSCVRAFRASVVKKGDGHPGNAESPERRKDDNWESSRRASGCILCLSWFRGSADPKDSSPE